jgi:hypothetical protein
VFARQGESGRIVIERRAGPLGRGVASLASLREFCRNVVRIGRCLILRQMARGAGRPQSGEFAAHVTAGARRGRVLAGQRESRRIVV